MEENIYRCESCGGIMEFDVKSQTLKCPNCESEKVINNDQSKIVEHQLTLDATRMIKPEEKESQTMECSGCGARIELGANDTAAKCPYCGSNYVLSNIQEAALIPDGVIPFKYDKNDVLLQFKTWIKKRWLAPNELKKLYQYGEFQGIYIPYWTFDAQADCDYTAEGGRDKKETYTDDEGNKRTRTKTDWYNTSGNVNAFFDDIQVTASKSFRSGFFKGVEPFDFNQLASYAPDYISGYLAENYSIGLDEGHTEAIEKIESELTNMAIRDVERKYDRARYIRISPDYSKETYKYLLLPVYSTTYSYKNETYTVMINGQTGKVKGDYPKSPVKIALIVIAIIFILILIIIYYLKIKK